MHADFLRSICPGISWDPKVQVPQTKILGKLNHYMCLNYSVKYNNTIFEMNDIYGIDNTAANIADET